MLSQREQKTPEASAFPTRQNATETDQQSPIKRRILADCACAALH